MTWQVLGRGLAGAPGAPGSGCRHPLSLPLELANQVEASRSLAPHRIPQQPPCPAAYEGKEIDVGADAVSAPPPPPPAAGDDGPAGSSAGRQSRLRPWLGADGGTGAAPALACAVALPVWSSRSRGSSSGRSKDTGPGATVAATSLGPGDSIRGPCRDLLDRDFGVAALRCR